MGDVLSELEGNLHWLRQDGGFCRKISFLDESDILMEKVEDAAAPGLSPVSKIGIEMAASSIVLLVEAVCIGQPALGVPPNPNLLKRILEHVRKLAGIFPFA